MVDLGVRFDIACHKPRLPIVPINAELDMMKVYHHSFLFAQDLIQEETIINLKIILFTTIYGNIFLLHVLLIYGTVCQICLWMLTLLMHLKQKC